MFIAAACGELPRIYNNTMVFRSPRSKKQMERDCVVVASGSTCRQFARA
jgi:hypothetical protein